MDAVFIGGRDIEGVSKGTYVCMLLPNGHTPRRHRQLSFSSDSRGQALF